MSQRLTTDYHIDPNSTNGTELADILNRAIEALDTSNAGAARPAYAKRGTIWLDESDIAAHSIAKVMLFDGAHDVEIGTINTSNGTFIVNAPVVGENILINGDFRINQRNFAGVWTALAIGGFGYDRWKTYNFAGLEIGQEIEPGNITDETHTLSWKGGTGDGRIGDSNAVKVSGISPISALILQSDPRVFVTVPKDATDIKLEIGTIATQFQPGDIGLELAKCQRYFWKPDAATRFVAAVSNAGTTSAAKKRRVLNIPFPVTMRAAPTSTESLIYATLLAKVLSAHGAFYNLEATSDGSTSEVELVEFDAEIHP